MKIQGGAVTLEIETEIVDQYAEQLATSLTGIKAVSLAVYKAADELQAQAVQNVSGNQVTFDGNTFVVNRQTGKLARSINVRRGPLSATVVADAEYASYVEEGVLHPVDMKQSLMGKTIPIRVSGPKGNRAGLGPISHPIYGNSNQDPEKTSATKVPKLSSSGKKVGNMFVIFRKVTKSSKGWIIAPRMPRPFMRAAAAEIEPKFAKAVEDAVVAHFGTLGSKK